MMRRCVSICTALLLITAACSSSDDDTAVDATEAAPDTTAEATAEPDATPNGETSEATPESTPEIELTASFTGITETEIRFGVAAIDTELIKDNFGIDLGVIPVADLYTAWSDTQNAQGGVNGRDLVPFVNTFLPVGPADSERVCLELIDDDEVFVVIGQFLEDNSLCITELKGHPYIGHFGENDEIQERSEGRFFATEMKQTDQRIGGTRAMIEAGDLDGRNVGLYWEGGVDSLHADAVRPILEEAGVDVVSEAEAPAVTNDTVANEEARDVIVQRFLADGVDLILNLSNINGITEAVSRAGADMTIAFTNGQAADRTVFAEVTASDDVKANTFAITTDKPSRDEALEDAGVQQCIAEFDAAFPDESLDLEDDNVVNGVTNHCRAFRLMVLVLTAAGGDITPETFITAGESLGTFDLPAMADATLGPDKHSAGSNVRRYEYDPELGWHVPVGDPIPATG